MKRRRWLVLFDWDGTLLNSLDVKIHNAGRLFATANNLQPELVEAAYRRHSGIPRRQLFDAIRADFELPPLSQEAFTSLSEQFTELNLRTLMAEGQDILPPETIPALAALHSLGCLLYVSSSANRREILSVAQALGLAGYFEEILGSSPGFSKGRDHIEYVRRKHSAALDELVFVGDDPADIRLSRAAGVFVIAKEGTHSRDRLSAEGPDRLVESLVEIPEILDS